MLVGERLELSGLKSFAHPGSPDSREPTPSQRELARQCGVSLVTVNAIANNRTTRVDLETIDAICGTLGVDPGDLFEREGGGVGMAD